MITSPKSNIEKYTQQGLWSDQKLHDLLYANAARNPSAIALVDAPNKVELMGHAPLRLNYKDLSDKIERTTSVLLQLGIKKDDILLVQMPNIVELVYVYMAASRIGAILSPVAMQYKQHELTNIINVLLPKVIITVSQFKSEDFTIHISKTLKHIFSCQPDILVWGDQSDYVDLYQEISRPSNDTVIDEYLKTTDVSANDILTICWTSGTEGLPKGIPRSHNQWLVTGSATFKGNQIREGEALLNPFPFINMASIGGLFLSWLYSGGKLVLHHPLDLPVFLQQIVAEEIEYTLVPPALLNTILKNEQLQKMCNFSKIRAIGSGSAPLDAWMVEGYKQQYDIEVVNHFGSNEGVSLLCGPSHSNTSDQRASLFPRQSDILESQIVDDKTHQVISAPGQVGELQIRGGGVFDGYYKSPEKNALSFTKDGYFKTGDLFMIDEVDPRYYRFVGRSKDIIIRGGINISPVELDSLLCAHEHITEAAVASYPCEVMGEKIAAFVVSKEGQDVDLAEVVRYLKSCEIASYKIPEKLVKVDKLPRNAIGKIVRFELAEQLVNEA
jgi:acyl-coenzyme A synthetase/AMP-(fatty) acid ligase